MKTAKLKYRIMELIDNQLLEPYYYARYSNSPTEIFWRNKFDTVEEALRAIENFLNTTCVDLMLNSGQFNFVIVSTVEIE